MNYILKAMLYTFLFFVICFIVIVGALFIMYLCDKFPSVMGIVGICVLGIIIVTIVFCIIYTFITEY